MIAVCLGWKVLAAALLTLFVVAVEYLDWCSSKQAPDNEERPAP